MSLLWAPVVGSSSGYCAITAANTCARGPVSAPPSATPCRERHPASAVARSARAVSRGLPFDRFPSASASRAGPGGVASTARGRRTRTAGDPPPRVASTLSPRRRRGSAGTGVPRFLRGRARRRLHADLRRPRREVMQGVQVEPERLEGRPRREPGRDRGEAEVGERVRGEVRLRVAAASAASSARAARDLLEPGSLFWLRLAVDRTRGVAT